MYLDTSVLVACDTEEARSVTGGVPLRTLNALHVAVCRELGVAIATFDGRLAAAATGSGLRVAV